MYYVDICYFSDMQEIRTFYVYFGGSYGLMDDFIYELGGFCQ